MGYQELFDQAQENGKTTQLGKETYRFEKEGNIVIGKLLSIDVIESKKFKKPVNVYTLETDTGVISFVLGGATDSKLEGVLEQDSIYSFEFKGQAKLQNGRTMNNFSVIRIDKSPDLV